MKKILLLVCILSGTASSQTLNRHMAMDSVWESAKLNVSYPEKALIIVHSQVPNLKFDEPNKSLMVEALGSGDWNVYVSPGTVRLKIMADGFQQLELQPMNFQRRQSYEMKISARGFTSADRADENLCEVLFRLNQSDVYASYGNFTPILWKSNSISFKVPKGEFTFRFQKAGYKDESRTLQVAGSLEIPIELQSGVGSVSTMKFNGYIMVQSNPPGAEIVVNGQKVGTTPSSTIELAAGHYELELRKPLYYADASVFDLKENESKDITRVLKPRFGFLSVTCTQTGASVFLDNKLMGTTPLDRSSIESGKHSLRVEMPLYHDHVEEFEIKDGDTKTAEVAMKPAFGSLDIVSAPESGADVYLDNVKAGVTPFSNPRIASGKYLMRVTKNLYNDVEEYVTVLDGFPMKRTVILGKNFGEVTITAPEQTIFVNGRNVGTGSYSARLAPGKYALRSERGEKYIPDQKDVFLSIGEPATVSLNAMPRLGSVSVVVEPFEARNADIYVNNELIARAPKSLPLIIGTHSILARTANFLDVTQTVNVKEGEQQKISFSMTTYEGSRQASKDAWGRSKWISAGVAVLAGAASYYCSTESDSYYEEYRMASTTAGAQTARDNADQFTTYTGIALGTAAAGGVAAIVSWIFQASR